MKKKKFSLDKLLSKKKNMSSSHHVYILNEISRQHEKHHAIII